MIIPLDVPQQMQSRFTENYNAITNDTERLFLFAADHKVEHLCPLVPERLFNLAAQPGIGAFATHLGLIARYGHTHPQINYIVKLNGKSNLVTSKEPHSAQLWDIDDVVTFQKNSGLNIRGIGYTIYLGSEYEQIMLAEAAQLIFKAHQQGLVAIVWIYPRGAAVKNELDAALTAGAASVATSVGADFVKLKMPQLATGISHEQALTTIMQAAGNTKVIFSGGAKQSANLFLQEVRGQLAAGSAGAAVGRNIFEQGDEGATAMIQALSKLIYP